MTDTKAPWLLPCPFCGGEVTSIGTSPAGFFVNCPECLASTNILVPEVGAATQEEAVREWNTRTDLSDAFALRAVEAALKAAADETAWAFDRRRILALSPADILASVKEAGDT
jgi:hypothetical protein